MSERFLLPASMTLTHLATLDLSGDGGEKLLQGQTSAQVALVDGIFAPLTCFCTPKGRMIANGQLMRLPDGRLRCLLHDDLVETVQQRLQTFAPFYQVDLQWRRDPRPIGCSTEDAQRLASALGIKLPTHPWQQVSSEGGDCLIRYPTDSDGYHWLLIPGDDGPYHIIPGSESIAWQLADIRRGLAWLNADQQDAFLPQMLNWEALGGISFKKGCYTGQEVVARAHFRGQVKKRLANARVPTATPIDPGDSVTDADGKTVGQVVASVNDNIVHDEGYQTELLAVLATRVLADDSETPLYIKDQRLSLKPLPYPIERLDPETLAADLSGQA